ncbi:TonB-linked outer membrane protein, SusC/RagA family [Thermoflexibacter ruber]|uniref:TonB-linked outer membrane protein, SusC/RagA family n=2 Tax=Thermoflexibacter ruber TaxID=1003 RepID=A0A1I2DJW7_9BACT|nr:TonB-linked outer membrane protein, SusC/RagA family [Thermoflexibacter ruber]
MKMKKLLLFSLMTILPIALLFAQGRQVKGKITSSEDGLPIPGVNVLVKGTQTGSITDAEGKFAISVPSDNAVLVVSYVGFISQEIPVGNQSEINVTLQADTKTLQDIIVVGYGTQSKSQLTGAISSVSSKEIAEIPVRSVQQALQGRAAGVDIVNTNNRPGSEPSVRIRGRRSFSAGNDPLYVVDGIPIEGGIGDINPQDIASLEILKDASATAIYGSRGANGVIIITTQRGKAGKSNITYDGYIGVSQALGKVDVMNGAQFAEYKRESRRATGAYPAGVSAEADKRLFEAVELESIALGRSTDYQSYLMRDGVQQSHQLSVTGGAEKTQFAITANYFDEKGIVYNQDFKRYTFRVNIDHQLTKNIKIGTSTLFSYNIRNGENFNPISGALAENPLGVPFDQNGNLIFLPTTDGLRTNPLAEIVPGAIIDENIRTRIFNSIYGEVKIANGLTYRMNFGPDLQFRRYGQFTGSQTNARRGGFPTGRTQQFSNFNYTLENILTYQKTFKEIHNLNVTALHSVQKNRSEYYDTRVQGIPAETQEFYNTGAASIIEGVGSNLTEWALQSYMGRVNYSYNDKYLLTFTARVDGSSRLAEGKKYSLFPSVAVGWNLSNEAFLKGSSTISNLKLRASYGRTGNQAINPYQTQGGLARTVYAFGNAGAFGYRPNAIPNSDLRWETSATLNIGLDFGLFNDRISGSLEYYITNTTDLLLARQLPITSGFSSVTQNIGATRNKGVELTLSTVNIDTDGGFQWTTDFNIFANREAIIDLYGDKKSDVGNLWFIGQPVTVFFDYEKIGIWQLNEVDEAKKYSQVPGQIKVKDQNNDGRINSDDRIILGSDVPKWSGGMTNRFEYKGFDLSIFAFARVGGMIRSRFHDSNNTLFGRYNNLNVDYWTPENPTNANPRPNQNQEFPIYGSTLSYFDGSFLKIRNIAIGYNFKSSVLSKLKIEGLRIYASAQQPFIFAPYRQKYKGIDPEAAGIRSNNRENAAELAGDTPSSRLIIFGVNVRF